MLLRADGTVALAPLYDLVSTRLYEMLDSDAAQRVNGVVSIDDITVDDLIAQCGNWAIAADTARRRITGVVTRLNDRLAAARRRTIDAGADPAVVEELMSVIASRLRRLTS